MKRALLVLALATPWTRATLAQTRVSLGLGVGTVRFPGGTNFSSATLSPALEYATADRYARFAGSLASLPERAWSLEGWGDVWAASRPLVQRVRIGVEGAWAGTMRTKGGRTAAAHGIGELLRWTPDWGVGLGAGPSGGWITDTPSVGAFHARARAWWSTAPGTTWQVAIEPTRLLGAWFTDVSGGVTIERGSVNATLSAAARLSHAYGSNAVGSVFLHWFAAPAVSLEAGGGSYLADPFQDLPRAGYLTAGVRLWGTGRPSPDGRAHRSPLVPERRGDSVVVRFRFEGAKAVAIAADWTAWRPAPLRRLARDHWEGAFLLTSGLYHFNILVDGRNWVVPHGVATVSDGLGGRVGVLLVP
jgi:hypothetical protein